MFAYEDEQVNIIKDDHSIEKELRPGFYEIRAKSMGIVSMNYVAMGERPIVPESASRIADEYFNINYIEQFFSDASRKIHSHLSLKNKLGIMATGKQGTGKTTICHALCNYLADHHNAVVFLLNSPDMGEFTCAVDFLRESKKQTDNFFSIIMADECDGLLRGNENHMKSVLDSNESLDNNLFLFTTNYPDMIPETITDRPSRIKHIIEVEGINDEITVNTIIKTMNDSLPDEVKLGDHKIKEMVPELTNETVDNIKNQFLNEVFKLNLQKEGLNEIAKEGVLADK